MANAVVILAHPYNKSFAACTAASAIEGFKKQNKKVDLIDLYADNFDPVINAKELADYKAGHTKDVQVNKYVKMLTEADEIVVIYPVWWSQAPAIYRGFVEKVLTNEAFRTIQPNGKWKGKASWIKRVQIYTTAFTPNLYSKFMMWNAHKNGVKSVFKTLGMKGIKHTSTDRIKTRKMSHKTKCLECAQGSCAVQL